MNKNMLRDLGLRITAPRLKVLNMLQGELSAHLTAEEIYQKLHQAGEQMSVATVYRVLADFEAVGLLIRHHFEGESAVYELDDGDHHHHLVCVFCQKVEEFCDEVMEHQMQKVSEQADFNMIRHTLTIYGACLACQSTKERG